MPRLDWETHKKGSAFPLPHLVDLSIKSIEAVAILDERERVVNEERERSDAGTSWLQMIETSYPERRWAGGL